MQREPNDLQMDEIALGIQQGLNVDWFANLEFTHEQMREIRLGLAYRLEQDLPKDLDISLYADPKFSPQQMAEIRLGLQNRVDANVYADPKFNAAQMKWIRLGLEKGVEVSSYLNPAYSSDQMAVIHNAYLEGTSRSFKQFLSPDFSCAQLKQIALGLQQNLGERLDLVSLYADPKFSSGQMEQIRLGLVEYLNCSCSPFMNPVIYIDPRFDSGQMYELRKGLEFGLDVSSYCSPTLDALTMSKRRQLLLMMRSLLYEKKLNSFSPEQKKAIQSGRLDILPYIQNQHTPQQIVALQWAALEGADIRTLNDPALSLEELDRRILQAPKNQAHYRFRPIEERNLSEMVLEQLSNHPQQNRSQHQQREETR